MSDAPNRNALWADALVEELAAAGLSAAVVAPGSRSTPLVVALFEHPDVRVFVHLDERSAAYFALGRGRRTGEPTAVVTTSGTATANLHPAVVEADRARVPLLALTADRPPELRDSGANQTVDQEKLYGGAVRWYRDLPEPEPTARKLRRLRVDSTRALAAARGRPAGPVHLNVPFRKPLEPTPVPGDVPEDWADGDDLAAEGRPTDDGRRPALRATAGDLDPTPATVEDLARSLVAADRPLVVAGPADPPVGVGSRPLATVAARAGGALLADPLSGLRFGPHVPETPVVGAYDGLLAAGVPEDWPDPDLVVRAGASPTSKPLRRYLRAADARDVVVDPAGGPEYREAEFAASDLVVADPDRLAAALADRLDGAPPTAWQSRWTDAARRFWSVVAAGLDDGTDGAGAAAAAVDGPHEGDLLAAVLADAPDPATLVVSNSMPVRDADRFWRPDDRALTALANRGASGIDGVTSTALGAASAVEEPLVAVLGDLAAYHDANGLLAVERFDLDATVVVLNNDGGGIFHELPIAEFDPPFTEGFRTPHGLSFDGLAATYGLRYERPSPGEFPAAYREAVDRPGGDLLEVVVDGERSHDRRERLTDAVATAFGE
jgi:2-succinyl-5-enolpyruvyl-6-hydroxy-3-cyclohexene-1-carboxylate synthase